MAVTVCLVLYVAAAGLLVMLEAAPPAEQEESCLVSLVIPSEKIKSSCDEKGKSNMKMQSIVGEITQLQRDIGELNVRITKILSRDNNNEEVSEISERVLNMENIKIPNIERRVSSLERVQKQRENFGIPRKRLVKMLKPVLKKEIKEIKKYLREEMVNELKANFKGTGEITSEILFNEVKNEKEEKPKSSKYMRSHAELASSVKDLPTKYFSKRFNKHLESLSRQFQYESTVKSPINNELPESDQPLQQDPLQADGRFDPRMDRLIEIFKEELTENLDQQTEKVKSITNRHLNEVEGKMTKILDIIEGIHAKYDNKLAEITEIAKKQHHKGNSSAGLENLEIDIKTLAASISALRSNFFDDPQFQLLFKQEFLTMENKIFGKFYEHTEPMRQEILYFNEQLEKSKTDNTLTKTTFQNYRADLRVKLHYMDQNISALNDQFAVINRTLLYPDYDQLDMEEAEGEVKIAQAAYFYDNIKNQWPNVIANISHLAELHVNDIDYMKGNFTDTQRKYSQLKESQKDLLKQINDIENNMDKFKDSLEDVEKYTNSKALEENRWIAYDFKHTFGRTGCFGGKQYVKKTGYKTGALVGVVLCSATRYKIYLGDALNATFLDIGDAESLGEDHCEFVGANKTSVIKVEKTTHIKMERLTGYFRHRWGQTPTKGNITFFWPTPYWYECGVRIPE